MLKKFRALLLLVLLPATVAGCLPAGRPTSPSPTTAPSPPPTMHPTPAPSLPAPTAAPTALPASTPPADPFSLISQEHLLSFIEDLTAIEPYSGWRNSGSSGEMQALGYVNSTLEGFPYLASLGLEVERQSFHVFLATEIRTSRLFLTVAGQEVEVPADALRGPRDEIAQALRFDSDGTLNDDTSNPQTAQGAALLVRSADELDALTPDEVAGRIVLLDYALVDRVLLGTDAATRIADDLLEKGPAGLILLTRFSNRIGESHGSFVGDVSAFNNVTAEPPVPILYARLEDLAPAGIYDWDDLTQVTQAHLVWDADLFSPGTSGNLVARIPGRDPNRAVILGAHIDSPNAPGAMDDGSGSAVLLEVARVLDQSRHQPPVDLYLVWFGSEELGLYGSGHFAATHQELLDRAIGFLQIDCLTYPLEGIEDVQLDLVAWPFSRLGEGRLPWPEALQEAAAGRGFTVYSEPYFGIYSDNSTVAGFDLPNADLIYQNEEAMDATGSFHYAAHIHDPYDTVDLARQAGEVLEEMAGVALTAAIVVPEATSDLRLSPPPDRRALFIASHTEAVHIGPASATDMGLALAMEGLDVDLLPYGHPLTPADLEGVDLAIILPVLDYPSPDGDPALYDEAWSEEEVAALEQFVLDGGLLVLTNSAHRLKYGNRVLDPNEDWSDLNLLAGRFGVTYRQGPIEDDRARAEAEHPLLERAASLDMAAENGVPFDLETGQVLSRAGGEAAIALIPYGSNGGAVLVLADVGLLGQGWGEPLNLRFWQNLARYARSR